MPLLLAAPQRMCSNSWGSELKRERCVYTLVGFLSHSTKEILVTPLYSRLGDHKFDLSLCFRW